MYRELQRVGEHLLGFDDARQVAVVEQQVGQGTGF